MENTVNSEQVLRFLMENGLEVTTSSAISNFLSTLVSTLIGAMFAGIVTLWVSRKFEYDRLKINNINNMYSIIIGTIFDSIATLRNMYFILEHIRLGATYEEQALVAISEELERTCKSLLLYCEMYQIELKDNEEDMRGIIIEYTQFMKEWDVYSMYGLQSAEHTAEIINKNRDMSTTLYCMIDKLNKHKYAKIYNNGSNTGI